MYKNPVYQKFQFNNHLVLLGVVSSAGLGSHDQGARSVFPGHVELDELQAVSSVELLVGHESVELRLGLDLEGLAGLLTTKDADEILELPVVDVVINSIHTVDESLNGETVVADDEAGKIVSMSPVCWVGSGCVENLHCGLELVSDHGAQFLSGQLE